MTSPVSRGNELVPQARYTGAPAASTASTTIASYCPQPLFWLLSLFAATIDEPMSLFAVQVASSTPSNAESAA